VSRQAKDKINPDRLAERLDKVGFNRSVNYINLVKKKKKKIPFQRL